MLMTKKYLYLPVLAVMLMVFVSFGCGGGGGSGNSSQSDNLPGWDTPPNPVADNRNNNNYNGNNGSTNQNQNQNQNPDTPTNPDTNNQNQDTNTGSDTPVAISGTWEIISGYAEIKDDGRDTISLTYKPGRIGEIGISMTQNNNIQCYILQIYPDS